MRTHQLESRMREIRPSGSEGGGTGPTGPPYPYHRTNGDWIPAFAGMAQDGLGQACPSGSAPSLRIAR
jgi:hypothetical protein